MSLAPLLDAAPAIPFHTVAAMTAFVLGVVQFAAPKGTLPHRAIGAIWVGLMAVVAVSSFWIHQLRLVGPWSPIHLLSIFTLLMLQNSFVVPTPNLVNVAPECEGVRHVREPLEQPLTTVMSFNSGLGGSNACLIFRKP